MKATSLYFKLLSSLKTPLILTLDTEYVGLTLGDWKMFSKDISDRMLIYEPEYFDCDDFAWVMKAAFAKMRVNGIGLVVGHTPQGLHAWNVILTKEGDIWQLEPQTGVIRKSMGRWPIAVIM